jgi:hypothetical protein
MYSIRPNLIIGFHGCDKKTAQKIINGREEMKPSTNPYDWLGNGIYFWENDYDRALEFAKERNIKNIEEPFVIGAVLNLGNCLDLTTRKSLRILKASYDVLQSTADNANLSQIRNKVGKGAITGDIRVRNLDCYLIESIHKFNDENHIAPYDSVRAGFWEGDELYEDAGFREKNHIQICIRNPQCVLGYFLPRNSKL